MAFDTLWIMAAHLLAAYEIVNPIDEEGMPITNETYLEYTNAMVRSVHPINSGSLQKLNHFDIASLLPIRLH